ncbi:uncharacterized protein LOC143534550 [Bidens hawaiensis]|uniref:uncharacterized protein LOC143534550 n=1 Tax=Bidens hawaiensis TaxID=980011 RepID=UPI00404947B8
MIIYSYHNLTGSSDPTISDQDVSRANIFINELTSLKPKPQSTNIEITKLLSLHMANLGAEVSYHKFQNQSNKFHPLHFFASPNADENRVNTTYESYGTNTIGIIRAPRGDGKESIVIVTHYNPVNITRNEALSLGIAYSTFSLLSRVSWLAKDIIWLAADSEYGEYNSVAAWLREYHTPSEISGTFTCGGTMAAAVVIKVADRGEECKQDVVNVYAEASNGQMPNLDLINDVTYLAINELGFRVHMEKVVSVLDSTWMKLIGRVFERVGNVVRKLNTKWKFGVSVKEYVEGSATLVSSLYHQALGVPTGSHGAFRDYQVDAITMEILLKLNSINEDRHIENMLQGGRLIEGVVRCVNNLIEKFHQSFFLYLLTSSNKFISVGVYMIAFLLLVAPLPVLAASLFSDTNKSTRGSNQNIKPFKSWTWLYPTKTIFLIYLWGALVSLLPYFIYQIPVSQPMSRLLILASFSLIILTFLASFLDARSTEWAVLKSVTVTTTFIGLCLMSVINYVTAEIGALILVPMCLMVKPWWLTGKVHSALNLVLVVIGFPGAAFFVVKSALGLQNGSVLVEFWYWMESLWAWNSATYIYICMVHLPC